MTTQKIDTEQVIIELNSLLDLADLSPEQKGEDEAAWEAEDKARQMVRQIYRVHDYRETGDLSVPVIPCGSSGFDDTPRVLYRLLYIFSAEARAAWHFNKHTHFLVDFEDMYKSESLFAVVSPDGSFVADPQFYKYKLCLQLRAAKGFVEGREFGVQCGVPGSDNGVHMAHPLLKAWWDLLLRLLNRKWSVYSGNNFEV